jgi:dipeptidyl aminopeptidase/acylaminoacyl peptidase
VTATVVVEGPPAVPDALHERLLQYESTRAAHLVSLSANAKEALVITRFAETGQAHLVSAPLGARKQLTFADEPIHDAKFDPSDAKGFFLVRDVGGAEDFQIYRFDKATGRSALLTDGKSRHEGLFVARDGSRIAYANNCRNGRDLDLYVADGKRRESEKRILEVKGSFKVMDISRDGAKALALEYVSILDTRLHVIDLATGAARQITKQDAPSGNRAAIFDKSGQKLFVASDREGEHTELYEVSLGDGEPAWKPLSREIAWSVEGLSLSPDGNTLAFTTNEDGYGVLHLLDVRTRKSKLAKGLPRGVVSGLAYARDVDVLALTIGSATSAADAYTYDVRKQKLTRWTESELGGLSRDTFIEPELIRYPSFDGRQIPAFVTKPRGAGPFPVVIDIHGGPESQARPGFRAFAQFLALEMGIATIVPNVRGSDGYGKTYLALDNGKLREDSVKDIGALLDWIAKPGSPLEKSLDDKRVAVMGGSYGGYMTLAALVHYGDRILGGIDTVGIADFVTFLENTRDYRRDLRRVEYGDESNPEMRAFLKSISPLTHVDKIQSALFVAHGANDPRVPLGEAKQIAEAVRARGREVWTMVAHNEGHGFRKKRNRDLQLELSAMFLERVLLKKPAAPSKGQ